jgi:hypothetical protein
MPRRAAQNYHLADAGAFSGLPEHDHELVISPALSLVSRAGGDRVHAEATGAQAHRGLHQS